jgi:hypothetical protein
MDFKLPSTWYASRKRIESTTKLIVFDDRGSLERSGDKLRFNGKKRTLEMSDLSTVEITGHKTNWVMYLVVNILLIPYFWLVGTPLVAAIAILVLANAFGLLVSLRTKWVHVAFRDAGGAPGEAYFADASTFGWGGILGGTQKLFEKLEGG